MNTFNTLSFLIHLSAKKQILNLNTNNLLLNFSGGTNYIDLSNTPLYSKTAAGLNNTVASGNTTYASLMYNGNYLKSTDFTSSNFTIYLKCAKKSYLPVFNVQKSSKIKLSAATVNAGSTITVQFYSLLLPGTTVPYTITGCTSENLSGASLTGTFKAPYDSRTYNVVSGDVTASISIAGGNIKTFIIEPYLSSAAKKLKLTFSGGTNYIDLSNTPLYSKTAAGLNNTVASGNTTYASLMYNGNYLKSTDFTSSNFTIYLKCAKKSYLPVFNVQKSSKIKLSAATVNAGSTITVQFYSLLLPGTTVPYTITGCTSENLSGASLTGTFKAPYDSRTYNVVSGIGSSASISITGGNTVSFIILS